MFGKYRRGVVACMYFWFKHVMEYGILNRCILLEVFDIVSLPGHGGIFFKVAGVDIHSE
jgi:hypothetical protein